MAYFCPNCSHPLADRDKTCPNCNADLTKRKSPSATGEPKHNSSHINKKTVRHEFKAIDQDISLHKTKLMDKRRLWTIVVVCVGFLVFSFFAFKGHTTAAFFVAIGTIIASAAIALNVFLTEDEYRSIGSSKNKSGQHQCIYCGHGGIYRSSPYKSSYVLAKCSKCKQILFSHPK